MSSLLPYSTAQLTIANVFVHGGGLTLWMIYSAALTCSNLKNTFRNLVHIVRTFLFSYRTCWHFLSSFFHSLFGNCNLTRSTCRTIDYFISQGAWITVRRVLSGTLSALFALRQQLDDTFGFRRLIWDPTDTSHYKVLINKMPYSFSLFCPLLFCSSHWSPSSHCRTVTLSVVAVSVVSCFCRWHSCLCLFSCNSCHCSGYSSPFIQNDQQTHMAVPCVSVTHL